MSINRSINKGGIYIIYFIHIHTHTHIDRYNGIWGPGGSVGKEPACQWRRHKRRGFNPRIRKIPRRRKWQPTPVFLPGKFHGQRSLAGYRPWGHKQLDTTEHVHACIHTHTHTHTHNGVLLSY